MKLPNAEVLQKVYGETEHSKRRFEALAEAYQRHFGSGEPEFFTAPGRTEIAGNHTDHNGGKVIAASINMDTIGAASPNHSEIIEIISEGYDKKIVVDISSVDTAPKEDGTPSLVAGMVKALKEFGFQVSGFQAYISTEVISSAGVSSSASFEMLICTIVNYFFNENRLTYVDYAKIGQYAENHYWNKASGLMDQLACAVGGAILLDFSSEELYKKVDFDFERYGCRLVIVNTGRGHADLSQEYSLVPLEMKAVANCMGISRLSEGSLDQLVSSIPDIEEKVKNDRAILRALHFYEENVRVEQIADAIHENKRETLIRMIAESGKSSWELLQNCYSLENFKEQKIALYLALTELFIKRKGDGCCRVHGGGFAGVIMSIISERDIHEYVSFISNYVGRNHVYQMRIRNIGAVHLEK